MELKIDIILLNEIFKKVEKSMRVHLLFVGNKFIYNKSLQEYVVRKVEQNCDFISCITYFKESDNALFMHLQTELASNNTLVVVTTKQKFSTIGKVISTLTEDNQILKNNMLLPSECSIYENASYLLAYDDALVNVIHVDETQKLPNLLIQKQNSYATLYIFEQTEDALSLMLNPLAHTHDVSIDIVNIIEGWSKINITSKKYGDISNFISGVKSQLSSCVIASSNIVAYIIEKLSHVNKKLSFAESCTGGLLSYYFTKNNGASNILDGALVTYSNGIKENWLAVEADVLEQYGAVSAQVVHQMSEGVLNVSEADYSISISGIAGDGGGTADKPVGTVYISVRSKTKHKEVHLCLQGDRNYVQYQSVLHGVKMLLLLDKELFFEI